MQLEAKLDKSASNLAKLNTNIEDQRDSNKDTSTASTKEELANNEVNLVEEMVTQIAIPIAYTANAEVITTQQSVDKTLLDIKA